MDKKIIGVLDNPTINAVFRTVSDYVADQNFGQMIASATPVNTDGSTKIIIWIKNNRFNLRPGILGSKLLKSDIFKYSSQYGMKKIGNQ